MIHLSRNPIFIIPVILMIDVFSLIRYISFIKKRAMDNWQAD